MVTDEALMKLVGSVEDRIRQIEMKGCPEGIGRKVSIDAVKTQLEKHDDTISGIFKAIDGINNKFFWFGLVLIVIAFMAGINVASILHLIPK